MDANDNNRPYLLDDGTLIIPFSCADHRFKYWKQEGMTLAEILAEINAPEELFARYSSGPRPDQKG
ncbi:MAG: hypothetical protein PHV85_07440 [Desulfovibrionaceae bacterium]|nr:hypothetical protein [Desulfovibrionaceae bacterium]MDD4952363.1 hypothetical protein [Desulfovibrionaceae bacterium]